MTEELEELPEPDASEGQKGWNRIPDPTQEEIHVRCRQIQDSWDDVTALSRQAVKPTPFEIPGAIKYGGVIEPPREYD